MAEARLITAYLLAGVNPCQGQTEANAFYVREVRRRRGSGDWLPYERRLESAACVVQSMHAQSMHAPTGFA